MPKLPPVSGKTMLRVLEARGFFVDRTSGSHYIPNNPSYASQWPFTVTVTCPGGL